MKFIVKGPEPTELLSWKAQANEDWQPTYDDLRDPEKTAVLNALLLDQGYLCCYCERSIAAGDCHIEHMIPQSNGNVDPLDYSNLLCSCQRDLKKVEPRHCGHKKDEWFEPNLFISPLDLQCERAFTFLPNGEILPGCESDEAASTTIEKLGLDIPKLTKMRKEVFEPFLDANLSELDLRDFVAGYLQKDKDGRFSAFHVAVETVFGTP